MKIFFWCALSLCIASASFAKPADYNDCRLNEPIVLVHGFMGFSKLAFALSYWQQVKDILEKCGTPFYEASLSQAQSPEVRGQELIAQLESFGHKKYHLIGHSQGGLDARYVLAKKPELLVSITTISSPHYGSKVADYLHEKLRQNTWSSLGLNLAGLSLSHTIGLLSLNKPHNQNLNDALYSLSEAGMQAFNQNYPEGLGGFCRQGAHKAQGVWLYSYGSTGLAEDYSYWDWFSYLMAKSRQLFNDDEPNDGLVSLCSMKFGHWLGELSTASHHLMPLGGLVSKASPGLLAKNKELLLQHLSRLKHLP